MNWKFWQNSELIENSSLIKRIAGGIVVSYLVICLALGWWWNKKPELFDVLENASLTAAKNNHNIVIGYVTTATLDRLAATLLDSGSADCMDQPVPGPEALATTEPGFLVLGHKSYGRNPAFLLRDGYRQIPHAFDLLEAQRERCE